MPDSILIVDGCPARRISLRQKLSTSHLKLVTASSGTEAIEVAEIVQPAVVLADTGLPDITAADFCQSLRSVSGLETVPVILSERTPEASAIDQAFLAGADEVVYAGVGTTFLNSLIRNYVSRQQKRNLMNQRVNTAGLAVSAEATSDAAVERKMQATTARIWFASEDRVRAAALVHDLGPLLPLSHLELVTPAEARAAISEKFGADIIILDLIGIDLRKALLEISDIRSRLAFCNGEVIVMTAPEDVETAAIALDLGAVMAVPASIGVSTMAARITSTLRNKYQSDLNWQLIDKSLKLAAFDPLTGLMNRRAGLFGLERMLEESLRRQKPMALLAVDLDSFKEVNDRHGHAVGDLVLGEVSIRMASILPADALCARMGGDEFVIALPTTNNFDAALFSAHLQDAVTSRPIKLPGGIEIKPRLSIGVVQTGTDGAETVAALMHAADKRLYRDKARRVTRTETRVVARAA